MCRSCNGKKLDHPPEVFYTPDELNKLTPIFEKQRDIFNFTFDWRYWSRDRKGYLISLGVEPQTVDELLSDPDHPDYIGPISSPNETSRVEISIDLSDAIESIIKDDAKNIDNRK